MVFLGLTKPNPASRRVAMDHGAQRGYNYPEPHVGATRAPPHAPTHDGTDDVKWRVTDGPCASMPYARDVNFVRVGAGAGDYAKAKGMMRRWSHFPTGMVRGHPGHRRRARESGVRLRKRAGGVDT